MGSNGRTPDFRFHLDTPEAQWLRGDEYYLAGWFFPVKDASSTLILEVDGNDQLVEPGLSRPDVVHDQAAPEARYSGFCVKFRHPKLSATVNLKVTRGNEISSV
ncbi:MAG: hypothetical protein JO217_10455, partial [Acidobacteriaceae bacterium]|nr:hypothetical protein [Acidobacteriaceae bacterium]